MLTSRSALLRALFFALSVPAILAFAACGGSDATATPDSGSNPTSISGGNNPTSTSVSSGDGGGLFDLSCSSLGTIGSIPGVDVDGEVSDDPTSDFAEDISNFVEEILDNSLSDATPACFYEASSGDSTGLWVGFNLDEAAPDDAASLVRDELIEYGFSEENISSYSTSGFAGLTITGNSVLGQYSNTGVALFITQDGVVLVAGDDGGTGEGDEPTATVPASGEEPDVTATVPPEQSPSGSLTEAMDAELRGQLESALGTSLVLGDNYSISSGGETSVFINYIPSSALSGDFQDEFKQVIEHFGGTVDSSINADGATLVYLSGATIDGQGFTGTISYSDGSVLIALQLE